jgi:hypothetical protein
MLLAAWDRQTQSSTQSHLPLPIHTQHCRLSALLFLSDPPFPSSSGSCKPESTASDAQRPGQCPYVGCCTSSNRNPCLPERPETTNRSLVHLAAIVQLSGDRYPSPAGPWRQACLNGVAPKSTAPLVYCARLPGEYLLPVTLAALGLAPANHCALSSVCACSPNLDISPLSSPLRCCEVMTRRHNLQTAQVTPTNISLNGVCNGPRTSIPLGPPRHAT